MLSINFKYIIKFMWMMSGSEKDNLNAYDIRLSQAF